MSIQDNGRRSFERRASRIVSHCGPDAPACEADRSVHGRFERQAEWNANRNAVEDFDGALTYADLNARANDLAHRLLAMLGEKEEAIGLYLDQSCSFAVALMGSLKARKFYVPMDPGFPAERNKRMLADAGCKLVITNTHHAGAVSAFTPPDYRIVTLDPHEDPVQTANPGLNIAAERTAYVNFTSGSTGAPKGVIQSHGVVLENNALYIDQFRMSEQDRASSLYTPSVNGAARDTYSALLSGATLCHYPLRERGIAGLANWIEQERITVFATVSSVFRRLVLGIEADRRFPHVRLVKIGGEAVLWRDVDGYLRHFEEASQLSCGLAMTEAGPVTQLFVDKNTRRHGQYVPLGEPVGDKELLLLDERGQAVNGVGAGEIAVRSRYLSPGYFGRDHLTERAFITDPGDPTVRTYRTGDKGERFADGRIEYRGREDWQEKISGFRVDISEVENKLLEIERIREAAVVAYAPVEGEKQLVAHVSLHPAQHTNEAALREQMRAHMPPHMVPRRILIHAELPQTPSGKIDRKSLPNPPERAVAVPAASPRSAIETTLQQMWAKELRNPDVGVEDDFFSLGGDSLQATQILLEANERFGVSMIAEAIFGPASTIAGMAKEIERLGGKLERSSNDSARRHAPVDIDFVEFAAVREVASKAAMFRIDRSSGLRRARPNVSFGAVSTNALGFRGPNIEPKKPEGTIRIAFMGSSGTFDRFVSGNDACWPHLVWSRLQKAHPNVRIDYVNAGHPGYFTRQMMKMFEDHIARLEPDVVLIYGNDLNADSAYLARTSKIYSGVHVRPSRLAKRWRLWGKVEQNLTFARRMLSVYSSEKKLKIDPQELTRQYRTRLENLIGLCRATAPVVAVVSGGGRLQRDQRRWQQYRASITNVYYMPYMSITGMIEAREAYQRAQIDTAEKTGCGLIDLAEAIPPDGAHYVDSTHFTDAGSRRMAETVSESLLVNPEFLSLMAQNEDSGGDGFDARKLASGGAAE